MKGALIWLLGLGLLVPSPASAVLVYERGGGPYHTAGRNQIIAANNDGTKPHLIAKGFSHRVSPSGRRVAFFVPTAHSLDLYAVGIGGHNRRRLARDVVDPVAWSPDDQDLVAGDISARGAFLINVEQATKKLVKTGPYGKASFAPDGDTFAVSTVPLHAPIYLTAVSVPSRQQRDLGEGSSPVWGLRGLAFARDVDGGPETKILLRKRVGADAHTLLHEQADLVAIDWSANGNRLLVAKSRPSAGEQALLIWVKSKTLKRIPTRFSAIEDLSKNGQVVLGESAGSVVSATSDGKTKLLASDATNPSWTK